MGSTTRQDAVADDRVAEQPDDEAPERRRARRVTWGAVGLLLLVAAVQLELWPLTAYRLFSSVRTDTLTSNVLVAVHEDGTTAVVAPDPDNPVLAPTGHRYRELVGAGPARQDRLVRAWLATGGIPADDVRAVRLEQVVRRMDPATLTWTELGSTVLVEVDVVPRGLAQDER